MKIAILSVNTGPTRPPHSYGYGGMERVNWWLAEELARLGHHVALFGAPGTIPPDGVQAVIYPKELCGFPAGLIEREAQDKALARWFREAWLLVPFDVVHDSSHRHPIALFCDGPILATMHNPNSRERWGQTVRNLVALSPAHSRIYGGVPYVFNGVPAGAVMYSEVKNAPFLYCGVMQPYKGAIYVIKAALLAGKRLVVAGTQWKSVYAHRCGDLIDASSKGHLIEVVGEIRGERKDYLLSHTKAVMLYVRWNEPGTLLGVEAMCAGAPIIGSNRGCIPDYVVHGKTGFICADVKKMVKAMQDIGKISPLAVRQRYWEHFTVGLQAQRYLELYERTAKGETW